MGSSDSAYLNRRTNSSRSPGTCPRPSAAIGNASGPPNTAHLLRLGDAIVRWSDETKTREDRLAQEPHEPVATVLAGGGIANRLCRHVHQLDGVIEFPVQQQSTVGTDRGALERELHGPIKLQSERARFRFTRRVRRQIPAPPLLTICEIDLITGHGVAKPAVIWGMRDNATASTRLVL